MLKRLSSKLQSFIHLHLNALKSMETIVLRIHKYNVHPVVFYNMAKAWRQVQQGLMKRPGAIVLTGSNFANVKFTSFDLRR